jgi:hypothetical protein
MPRIVRAEFLSYYNPRRNSDKLFNVFVIDTDDGYYACVSEYGRRGTNLIRDTLCTRATRELAMSKLRQKLSAKRNHRETPYADEPFGYNYSPIAREYGYINRTENDGAASNRINRQSATAVEVTPVAKENVIAFPVEKTESRKNEPKRAGIFNQEQFDSLEI